MPVVKTGYCTVYYNEKGQYHREDGPAIEYSNGGKQWWQNGKLHRLDGPAIINVNGKYYYINDENIPSKEQFDRLIKLKAIW